MAALSAVSNKNIKITKKDFEFAFDKTKRKYKNLVNKNDKSKSFWDQIATLKAAEAFIDKKLEINSIQKIELLALNDFFQIEEIGELGTIRLKDVYKKNNNPEYVEKKFTTK